MKCNAGVSNGKRKPNQFALIKNKKKIEHVGKLGMLYDKLEAEYNQLPEDSCEREELKSKMDEIEQQIITMSAEINDEVFKTKRSVAAAESEDPSEQGENTGSESVEIESCEADKDLKDGEEQ